MSRSQNRLVSHSQLSGHLSWVVFLRSALRAALRPPTEFGKDDDGTGHAEEVEDEETCDALQHEPGKHVIRPETPEKKKKHGALKCCLTLNHIQLGIKVYRIIKNPTDIYIYRYMYQHALPIKLAVGVLGGKVSMKTNPHPFIIHE